MENWKEIPGYEGRYDVSDQGRVRSYLGYGAEPRILHPILNSYGYMVVNLYKEDGEPKLIGIHRLVAMAFIPNPNNYPHIDHINTIRYDNRVGNLRWCTVQMNMNNPITIEKRRGRPCKKVAQFRMVPFRINSVGEKVKEFNSVFDAAAEMCVNPSSIFRACKTGGTSCGYFWKYI